MPFFFSKKPSSVAQDLRLAGEHGPGSVPADTFEVEMLGHLDTLYGVSCRMTKSSTEAEDLVQDTIVKAMRAKAQFQPGTNLKAWLLRILTNTFINRYRRGGLERDLIGGPDAESLTDGWVGANTMRAMRDPETQALTPLVEAEVQRALDELPDEFRLAVVLSDIEELSYKEIAEAMGCPIGPKLIRLRYAVGLAAAAGVVFAMGMSRHAHQPRDPFALLTPKQSDVATTMTGFDILDDLISLHANPLPPETTNPEELQRWDPLVGVPVRRPPFQPFGASFSGARVHSMSDRRAALLQYTLRGGHRVTVYVFNPRVVQVNTMRLEERTVHERSVFVGSLRGYSIAAAEQSGVGYALASDLGTDQSTNMVLAAVQQ
jgi:RNA polymerase sigma-70 factor (ECF subfamily)